MTPRLCDCAEPAARGEDWPDDMHRMEDGYEGFLRRKRIVDPDTGIQVNAGVLASALFPFQRDITRWALRRGRAAVFADCGLGKTLMQLEWAQHIPGRVLILAPLAVAQQTEREGRKFGIEAVYVRTQGASSEKILVTNYEMLEHFDLSAFEGIVLDESSILKSYEGKFRTHVIQACQSIPFRLACTATPAPNDYMELGNHSEFLGVMNRTEMLAMFFVHDGGETQKWRLKGHAQDAFWRWMCSWAVMLRKPSDLGYEDNGFILPEVVYHRHEVEAEATAGYLFPLGAQSLPERLTARRGSVDIRAAQCAEIVNRTPGQWLLWCNLNSESEAAASAIDGAVEVRGSDSREHKEAAILRFISGEIRVLVSKPSIFGFGLNLQNCNQVAFLGLSDSYEQFYQAVRRSWRFGQEKSVQVHIITANTEGAVVANIKRKEAEAAALAEGMVAHMHDLNVESLHGTKRDKATYERNVASGKGWTLILADCIDAVKETESDSIPYSIFSPPFASLYTYSNSERDMGNSRDGQEFAEHFAFLVSELFRVTMPGRLCSFHCMNLPTSKTRDGVIGLRDFRGELIRMFEAAGWIYHSEVVIWKDPVTAMQRTKALGLLHKQLKKDSAMSRQGIPDYLVTMRKPGVNPKPVTHTNESFPVSVWQRYASPIWTDIKAQDTLQYRAARAEEDERHICPLQLEVIRRAMQIWTNPGDVVFSPFAGIGSEGYVAIEEGRQFLGVELKRSYWEQAQSNLRAAKPPRSLFDAEEGKRGANSFGSEPDV